MLTNVCLLINSPLRYPLEKEREKPSSPLELVNVKSIGILIGKERSLECRMNVNSYVQMRLAVAGLQANVLLEKILTTGSKASHSTIDRPVNKGTRESNGQRGKDELVETLERNERDIMKGRKWILKRAVDEQRISRFGFENVVEWVIQRRGWKASQTKSTQR